jgi:crossover junction endodeoxyribonuclease RuvC
MIVLGIDPGTATTGFGVLRELEDGSLETLDYGAILTPAGLPMPERLLELYEQLQKLILLHRPESAAVEKLFFQRNVRTALSVGQGRGVVLLTLAQAGIEVAEYTPLEVKQAVVGYGSADKAQVSLMVKALLELDSIPTPDDAADALAIAICHVHSARIKSLGSTQSL